MLKTTLYILFFLLTLQAFGQIDKLDKHPIDLALEKCLESDTNYSTYNMMDCIAIAFVEWDKELNKYYQLLIDTLQKDLKEKLKSTQQQWIHYKDKEINFMATLFYNMQGTMWRVVAAERKKEIVKIRAVELKEYYDTVTFK